jgi:hypothetical protein
MVPALNSTKYSSHCFLPTQCVCAFEGFAQYTAICSMNCISRSVLGIMLVFVYCDAGIEFVCLFEILFRARAVSQVVSRQPLTLMSRFRAWVSPCEICGGHGVSDDYASSSELLLAEGQGVETWEATKKSVDIKMLYSSV